MEGGNTFPITKPSCPAKPILRQREKKGLGFESIPGDQLVAAAREGQGVSDPAGVPPQSVGRCALPNHTGTLPSGITDTQPISHTKQDSLCHLYCLPGQQNSAGQHHPPLTLLHPQMEQSWASGHPSRSKAPLQDAAPLCSSCRHSGTR